jgi:DNA-binding MarR family transcriptional regulator
MAERIASKVSRDFLGSAHVFASAIREVLEDRLMRQVAGNRLGFSQLKLLTFVAHTDSRTVNDVAAFLGVSKAAASQAVDRLVRRKWLRRTEGEVDRRFAKLSLTDSGHRLLANYEAAKARKLGEIFRGFSMTELRHAADLLDRVSAQIVNHSAKPEEVCLQCGIYFRERCLLRTLVGRNCFYHKHRTGGLERRGP